MENSIGVHSRSATHAARTRFKVLGAISFSHFLNDTIQSLIVAIYPLLWAAAGYAVVGVTEPKP
jgi:FSR family fosmidomycin resistance protein-like MFS transporter